MKQWWMAAPCCGRGDLCSQSEARMGPRFTNERPLRGQRRIRRREKLYWRHMELICMQRTSCPVNAGKHHIVVGVGKAAKKTKALAFGAPSYGSWTPLLCGGYVTSFVCWYSEKFACSVFCSSGRLELLECDAVGLRGMAAGVRLESDAGPGLESEKELQE